MAYGDLPLDAPLKPNKGEEGGACNRQSCQAEPALHWNHGSHSWYCGDCARDIGEDSFNKRDWDLNWRPRLGHAMFETREEMDERKWGEEPSPESTPAPFETIFDDPMFHMFPHPFSMGKAKSSSLQRMLGKQKRR